MANTTNYNWETPDDTDLVKDGAAAIRTLGSSIDTTTKNLNPQTTTGAIAYRSATANVNTALPIGTAGQILAVSGGVPAWINNDQGDITEVQAGTGISVASGTGPIPVVTNTVATEFDAKGDLVVGTGSDTFDRLAVGTNTYILTADSAEATGLKWAAPAGGGGWTQIGSTTNLSGSSTSITSIPGTYYQLVILVEDYYASGDVNPFIYLNADTGSNYKGFMIRASNGGFGSTYISSPYIEYFGLRSNQDDNFTVITINNYAGGTKKLIECRSAVRESATYEGMPSQTNIVWNNSAAVTSIAIATDTGTWSAGTIKVYGVK